MIIKRHSSAFTLIELLVVISIIGILATLAMVSYTGSQRQVRDTKRKSDLKQYQTALEAYANQHDGLYISRINEKPAASGSYNLCSDLNMTDCPEDPRNSVDSEFYHYLYVSNGTGYGEVTASEYGLVTGMESANGKYWVICSNGKSGESTIKPYCDGGVPNCTFVCPL